MPSPCAVMPPSGRGTCGTSGKVIEEGEASVDLVSYAHGLSRELVEQILAAG